MNYQLADTPEVNDFIAAVNSGRIKITAQDASALCTELHSATVELPEMLWLSINFENLADAWHNAIQLTEKTEGMP